MVTGEKRRVGGLGGDRSERQIVCQSSEQDLPVGEKRQAARMVEGGMWWKVGVGSETPPRPQQRPLTEAASASCKKTS